MSIDLTTGQWVSVAGVVVGVVVGVNALRTDRRWFALCCGLITMQCLVSLVVPHDDANHFTRYFVTLPFGIAVLAILRRVVDEGRRTRLAQAGNPPRPQA